jgi:hypothetical protein
MIMSAFDTDFLPTPSGKYLHLTYAELLHERKLLEAHPDHNWRLKDEIADVDAHLAALDTEMMAMNDDQVMNEMFAQYEREQEIKAFESDPDYQEYRRGA